jgi:hypothetical protein
LPEFKFDDITTFKAIVMNADPKLDNDGDSAEKLKNGAEIGIDGIANGTENDIDGIEKVTDKVLALINEDNGISKKNKTERKKYASHLTINIRMLVLTSPLPLPASLNGERNISNKKMNIHTIGTETVDFFFQIINVKRLQITSLVQDGRFLIYLADKYVPSSGKV